jgi:PDZ domain-containing secreted protein/Zn-dependent protease
MADPQSLLLPGRTDALLDRWRGPRGANDVVEDDAPWWGVGPGTLPPAPLSEPRSATAVMDATVQFLRVRGVSIGAHWSWFLIFAIVVWSLATALFPATYPGLDGTTYLVMALAAAALFFGSVLAHELGHALRGIREGLPIEGITLWLLGGVARLGGTPPSPGAEFRVAIFGPLITALAILVFGGAMFVGERLAWPAAVRGVADYVTRINAIVLAFNLVPALPLDGGRVLRAWLWRRQRSFLAATHSAARAGQAFAVVLIVIGLLDLFGGASMSGVWLAFLGWFLLQAAQSERVMATVRMALGGARVRDVMTENGAATGPAPPGAPTVDADEPVLAVLPRISDRAGRAMVTERGRVVGVLSPADVARAVETGRAREREEEPARAAGFLVWAVVGVVIVVAGLALYHPPYVVMAPGPALDVADSISISGAPVTPVNGEYLLTSVSLSRPSALRTLVAAIRPDREVLPLAAVIPPGVPAEEYSRRQREVFAESRMLAAAAAARAVGLPVEISGRGARVVDVLQGSPARESLRPGDVIVAVDGEQIEQANELGELVRSRPAGSELRLSVHRGDGRLDVVVRSRQLPQISGGVGIGVAVETRDLDVDLPFDVDFEEVDVGGPSAGLAYAVAVADLLSPVDYADGRTVATTGTIDLDGEVGLVGGVEQKADDARRAGAELFLVPTEEVDDAEVDGLAVRGVESLEEGLRTLRSTA